MITTTATILVVDDHPTNLKLACDVLEFEGYRIRRAVNAREAMEIISESPPDLILMDIAMPGMDGLTLTRKLKADARTRHILIVVLSAFAMKGDDQKALAAGGDGYITKPIDTRTLPATMAEFLGRAQPCVLLSPLKILIIEDHMPQLKLAHHILAAAGHSVSKVMAAEEAPQAIRDNKPQAILLDLNLPGMDGLQFARNLRTDDQTRDIRVIAFTSFPEKFPQAAALEAGCALYLLKPINTRTLSAEIVQACSTPRRKT